MLNVLLVAGGGALGSAARYLLNGFVQGRMGPHFPWGTILVNVTGSLFIGFILGLFQSGDISSEARLFFAVGLLGGYTTFSTFSHDTLGLLATGTLAPVLLNTLGQVIAGLMAVYLGLVIARFFA